MLCKSFCKSLCKSSAEVDAKVCAKVLQKIVQKFVQKFCKSLCKSLCKSWPHVHICDVGLTFAETFSKIFAELLQKLFQKKLRNFCKNFCRTLAQTFAETRKQNCGAAWATMARLLAASTNQPNAVLTAIADRSSAAHFDLPKPKISEKPAAHLFCKFAKKNPPGHNPI